MPNSTLKSSAYLLALFVCSGFVMALWHGGGGSDVVGDRNQDVVGHPRRLMGHGGHHDDDDLEAKAENAALARRDSADNFSRLDALLFTATRHGFSFRRIALLFHDRRHCRSPA